MRIYTSTNFTAEWMIRYCFFYAIREYFYQKWRGLPSCTTICYKWNIITLNFRSRIFSLAHFFPCIRCSSNFIIISILTCYESLKIYLCIRDESKCLISGFPGHYVHSVQAKLLNVKITFMSKLSAEIIYSFLWTDSLHVSYFLSHDMTSFPFIFHTLQLS